MLGVVMLGLMLPVVGAALLLPQALEAWLHRHRASRLARWAFVPLGARRLSPDAEGVRRVADGYRTTSREALAPHLPAGRWSMADLDAEVAADGSHATIRVDVPFTRFPVWNKPMRVVATLRVTPSRDAEGLVLRAHVLPNWLATWSCVPLLIPWFAASETIIARGPRSAAAPAAWAALSDLDPSVMIVGAACACVATLIGQSMWWTLNRPVLVRSSNRALEVLARHWESSLTRSP